jgi:hypothetical protein
MGSCMKVCKLSTELDVVSFMILISAITAGVAHTTAEYLDDRYGVGI